MSSSEPDTSAFEVPPATAPPQEAGAGVVVVGDIHSSAGEVRRELKRHGYQAVVAGSVADAVASIAVATPAVVVIDLALTDGGGLTLCEQLKRDSATRLLPVLVLSESQYRRDRLEVIHAGADAILPKPVDPEELLARIRACVRTSLFVSDLDSAASIIMTLTAMLEARESSPGHCHRMANYAMALGRVLQLEAADRQALYRGAFLHDIGMLAIPNVILRKERRLDPDEFEVIKSHTVVGDALCANLKSLHSVRPIVRHHHERRDGSGYPDQLRGDEVPVLAQIVGIVDVFEAITMGRAYLAPRPVVEAIRVLRAEVEVGWRRRDLVEAFATLAQSGALDYRARAGAGGDAPEGVPAEFVGSTVRRHPESGEGRRT